MKSFAFIRILVGATVLASICAGNAVAQPIRAPEGRWSGSLDVRTPSRLDKLVPVTLTVASVSVGQSAGTIRFGAPKSCSVTLQFSGVDADQDFWYRVIGSNGGYCLRLQNSNAVVEIKSGKGSSVELNIAETGIFWGGVLSEASLSGQ
jgi:hypothetical protein